MKNSQLVGQDFPDAVSPGQSFPASVTFLNTGDETWTTAGPNWYAAGSQPENDLTWGVNRLHLQADTPPGELGVFSGTLTAPLGEGFRSCKWRTLHENVAWFGQTASPFVYVGDPAGRTTQSTRPLRAPADADDLVGDLLADTGPVVMDGLLRKVRWQNATGVDLLVHKAAAWSGVQGGTNADVNCEWRRESDGLLLVQVPWDRYAEPTAPNNVIYQDFHKPALLAAGDALVLSCYALQYAGPAGGLSHHRGYAWFTGV